jgi:hypothetical protein
MYWRAFYLSCYSNEFIAQRAIQHKNLLEDTLLGPSQFSEERRIRVLCRGVSKDNLHPDGILRQTQAMNHHLISQEAFNAGTAWSEAGASISGVTSSD